MPYQVGLYSTSARPVPVRRASRDADDEDMSTAATTPAEDAEFRGRSGGGSHVGTKPFERALLRLNAAVGVSLPGPSTQAHPLSGLTPVSPSLQIAWSEIHPALHPNWLAQRENLDSRIKERQAQRTALRSERKAQQIESLAALALVLATDAVLSVAILGTADATGGTAGAEPFRIVDFAGGSGPLALPLAALLPSCTVVIVDVNAAWSKCPRTATRRSRSPLACSSLPSGPERRTPLRQRSSALRPRSPTLRLPLAPTLSR